MIFIRLVQEPRGSLPSPAEFAAHDGNFPVFSGKTGSRVFRSIVISFERRMDAARLLNQHRFLWLTVFRLYDLSEPPTGGEA
jgi:hypothetical protein